MNTTLAAVLRDGLVRLARKVTLSMTARSSSGPVDVPKLSTVDDTPRGRSARDDPARDARRRDRDEDANPSPGQLGPTATVQVDVTQLDPPHTTFNPQLDGDPDPGEVVWTWVPYEEADGRGKDRPVLVVAREAGGSVLAIQLSSRDHDRDHGWTRLGAGGWDPRGRSSWADLERVLRVHPDGMRREGDIADRDDFDRVVDDLAEFHHWN